MVQIHPQRCNDRHFGHHGSVSDMGAPAPSAPFEPLDESRTGAALVHPQYLARTRSGKLIAAPPGPSRWAGGITGNPKLRGLRHAKKRNRKAGRL